MSETFVPTVFVVDDDPSVRTAVQRLLASVGLPCETFANAADFLNRSTSGVSGCLVLDVRMPGASGLDLQRMLNQTEMNLPVIFVTAHADVPLTVRAMKGGALEVLTKPFDDQALLDAVYHALEQERVRSQDRQELHRLRESLRDPDGPRTRGHGPRRLRPAQQADCRRAWDGREDHQGAPSPGDAQDGGRIPRRARPYDRPPGPVVPGVSDFDPA